MQYTGLNIEQGHEHASSNTFAKGAG